MVAVEAEGEAEEIGLVGIVGEAVVGKICDFICFKIKDGERLFFAGGVGAVAAVEEYGELVVGREDGGGGEIVDGTGMAGDFAEDAAVGQVYGRLLGL